MPRNSSGVMSKPAGTTAMPNTTIASAPFNTLMDDIVSDLNAARPVTSGGTGATAAGAALTNLGFSDFIKTLVDDADATAARVTLGVIDKVLRYDAAQTLTGTDLTQAQANLRAILGGYYETSRVTAAGTAWVFDLPDTATSFRVTLDSLRIASGSGSITMRCGPAAGSADAGAADYLNKVIFAQDGATSASATLVNSSTMPVAAVGAAGRTYARIEGGLGSAASPFQGGMSISDGDALLNSIADRRFTRLANGRKGRLFFSSDVAVTGGTITVEVKT